MQFLEYMAAAYAVIWGAVLVYFVSLSRKEKEIWEAIHDVRRRLSDGEETERASRGLAEVIDDVCFHPCISDNFQCFP